MSWCGVILKMQNKNQKIRIHFIGIGGIGMSGIAELMKKIGYTVSGSDIIESENVKRLKANWYSCEYRTS